MAVVSTDKWLNEFISARKSTRKDELTSLQCSILCDRLVNLFRDGLPEEIHYTLQQQGLFLPHEEVDVEKLKKHNVWDCVQQEFLYLQRKWNGPSIPIYIFPITQQQTMTNKNGVAYPHSLFLFVGDLEKQELQALLAHEYNHVCRIHILRKTLEDMTLLDSLILEGLAEDAVKELYGEKWIAPWIQSYSDKELLALWETHFLPNLQLQGIEQHGPFLYGGDLPPWIGYCIGYKIVQSYKINHSCHHPLFISSQDLLVGSNFPLQ
ncbi:hypothetical protein JTI58_06940 [Lysinibacillus fusiformis]|uniref:DUF2268 domain-containing protein n=1 Tax=Lysinibacillus fusiformis TaxID=28031 RepID=UPI0019674EA5|nr:DUF2268 domain-containing putative Zn-dependent protease [Lysinibacillus fusiformis]QSB11363.1 hypothetical protein JTI58_06940 [Lysinibacillus fusiformis]